MVTLRYTVLYRLLAPICRLRTLGGPTISTQYLGSRSSRCLSPNSTTPSSPKLPHPEKFRGSRRYGIWAKGDVTGFSRTCRGRHGEVGIVELGLYAGDDVMLVWVGKCFRGTAPWNRNECRLPTRRRRSDFCTTGRLSFGGGRPCGKLGKVREFNENWRIATRLLASVQFLLGGKLGKILKC